MKLYSLIILLVSMSFLASCSSEIDSDMQNAENVNQEQNTPNEDTMTDEDTMDSNVSENVETSYIVENNSYTFTTENGDSVKVNPISHATMVLNWADTTMYIDPAEPIESYAAFDAPNVILVTHEHGDHFKLEVLEELVIDGVELIVNDGVYQKLSPELQEKAIVMANGDIDSLIGFEITAIPAYNIREEALNYHPKGRDNGYLIEQNGFRVYVSGDTEDTPEMRALEDIDVAFVSMNLPYTMPIDSAIEGVRAFAPKTIFPYHFRGEDGMSDVEQLKTQVESNNENIDVVLANWY